MLVKNTEHFNLTQTFECGQCFRWNPDGQGGYTGVAGGRVLHARLSPEGILLSGEDGDFLRAYFDLDRDYGAITRALWADERIRPAVEAGGGIRLLRQEPWETLASFLLSSNNNIARIKGIVETLCRLFGTPLEDGFFSFPSAEAVARLSLTDLAPLKSGYRDKYLLDAARKAASGELSLDGLFAMGADEAREALKTVNGVGNKVADCVLLFAFQKFGVFPKDVWIRRAVTRLYQVEERAIDAWVAERFGAYGGFAQQYLFYHAREEKTG